MPRKRKRRKRRKRSRLKRVYIVYKTRTQIKRPRKPKGYRLGYVAHGKIHILK